MSVSWTPGTILVGRYRLENELGRGGMAVVYKAWDKRFAQPVALKVLKSTLDHAHLAMERLKREAEAYEHLSHPHIVRLYDFIMDDELAFLSMEFVDGPSLKQKLLMDGRLSVTETTRIALQIASALDSAHRQGVIHRDIKPQNVLLDASGQVKVVDFGMARLNTAAGLTATRTTLGTPEYMPPEQILAQPVDPRADLYSFGILLYECLVGRPPFSGHDVFAILQQHLHTSVPSVAALRPDVPPWMEEIVSACLRKRKEERVRSAAALIEAFELARTGGAMTLSLARIPVPPDVASKECCIRCQGPVPELIGFCLHCGSQPGFSLKTVDELVSSDRERWERENKEFLRGLNRLLPSQLVRSISRKVEQRQKTELETISKQAKEVEKLRQELELPMENLSFDEQAVLVVGGRRAARRWRHRKSRMNILKLERPLRRWMFLAKKEGFASALQRLPSRNQGAFKGLAIAAIIFFVIGGPIQMAFLMLFCSVIPLARGAARMEQEGKLLSGAADDSTRPGGFLGAARLEELHAFILQKPSKRILEPFGRLLTALAQAIRLAKDKHSRVSESLGDLNGPICSLVDLALVLGKKAHALEQFVAREAVTELEAELERLGQRLKVVGPELALDIEKLKKKKEETLLKRLDLDRQQEQLLTRLSLTAAEAEDLLASMHRLVNTQEPDFDKRPSEIFQSLQFQMQAMEELFTVVSPPPELREISESKEMTLEFKNRSLGENK